MKTMIHRDEVHGDVRFDQVAVALLDTPAMQRLGRVLQLGFSHLVYRGGTHTRLSHVMGAYHTSGKLVDSLRRNYSAGANGPHGAIPPNDFLPRVKNAKTREDERWEVLRYLVGWAALLHDLAHIPLGHTLEDEFDHLYEKHDDFRSPRIPFLWIGEKNGPYPAIRDILSNTKLLPPVFRDLSIRGSEVWQSVMLTCLFKESISDAQQSNGFDKRLEAAEESPTRDALRDALREVGDRLFFPYMADIVADTICADYLDYLQRDPRNLGLDVLRDDRVVSQFWIGKPKGLNRLSMALSLVDRRGKPRLDTTTGVVDLVRQRYRFAEIVYYHKTKASASAMFAKALSLLDIPPEVPSVLREPIEQSDVATLSAALLSGAIDAAGLRARALPGSLMDPEVGDESLHLMLTHRAVEMVEAAAVKRDASIIDKGLRAMSLLHAIPRRRLYKVVFAMDSTNYRDLQRGSIDATALNKQLSTMINSLRKDGSYRSKLEASMRDALPAENRLPDSFLLYIPPRKSQAKGIETGALDRGDVITLGAHPVVNAQVQDLNSKYSALWRLLVFAHPSISDPVSLSGAVRALVGGLIPDVEFTNDGPGKGTARDAMESASWFEYLHPEFEKAGRIYGELLNPTERHYHYIALANGTTDGNPTDQELAYRAVLLGRLLAHKQPWTAKKAAHFLRERFSKRNGVVDEVAATKTAGLLMLGGTRDSDLVNEALDTLAKTLLDGVND